MVWYGSEVVGVGVGEVGFCGVCWCVEWGRGGGFGGWVQVFFFLVALGFSTMVCESMGILISRWYI